MNPSIIIKAQENAIKAVEEHCRFLRIPQPCWNELLQNSDLYHIYLIALVDGAIQEYNSQLLAALKEQNRLIVEDFTQISYQVRKDK